MTLRQQLRPYPFARACHFGWPKPIVRLPSRLPMMFVEADERAAADEQDVRRVHLDVLLLGMLAAALRRNVGDGAFEHLQQGLLHAFAARRRG